jgi:hypothetical protein
MKLLIALAVVCILSSALYGEAKDSLQALRQHFAQSTLGA